MPAPENVRTHDEPISVSSDVLARLGEELITNHVQALAELVKNAYDADATLVKMDIDTTQIVTDAGGTGRRGILAVADNGFGMDDQAIRRGWLRVSSSPKRAMKLAGIKTPKQRTPLGDKGLGRLGAQRLGDRVRIRTRPQVTQQDTTSPAYIEHDVEFSFSSFSPELDVGQLKVPWTEYPLPTHETETEPWPLRKATGTVLEISGLRNLDDWADLQQLERALSLLVNPFKGVEKFSVSVTVDGHRLNLLSVANKVRSAALSGWEGTFDGQTLSIDGHVRLQWFNVRDREDQQLLQDLLQRDDGASLREFIVDETKNEKFDVTRPTKPWLLQVHRELRLSELDSTGLDLEPEPYAGADGEDPEAATPEAAASGSEDGPGDAQAAEDGNQASGRLPINPGDFLFEMDVVSRRIGTARAAGFSALDRQKDYSDWLNERGGIHVYRDGFRINLGTDVMRLGEAFSSSSSYYGLRPANVIGYIEISAESNRGLEETTDREGFRETPEVKTFQRLIEVIRDEVNDVLDALGRSTGAYLRRHRTDDDESTEELAEELADAADDATKVRNVVAAAQQQVAKIVASPTPNARSQTEALRSASAALDGADRALARMTAAAKLGAAVRRDIADLEERVEDYAQLIGLGLVAETLSHEINHVSGRLSGQITDLQSRAAELEPWARAYLQETRSALDALHGHLQHLDPMLRYARTKREDIELGAFAAEMSAFHASRLRDKRIDIASSSLDPGICTPTEAVSCRFSTTS